MSDKLPRGADQPDRLAKLLTQSLEAPNIGTNKMFINVNGKTSKLVTNQNAKLQYKLNNPFKLNVGDRVTLYQAFVNEGGLNTDTLSFQEDIQSTIKFLYYMPSQLFMNKKPDLTNGSTTGGLPPQQGGSTLPSPYNNQCLTFSDYQDFACFPSQMFLCRDPIHENNASGSRDTLYSYRNFFSELAIPFSDVFGGDMGTPYYLFENHHDEHVVDGRVTGGSNAYVKPAYGEVTINIPAGNYEASSLAKNITEQFNGAFIRNANNSNFLTDRLYNPDSANYAGTDTSNPFGNQYGKATTKVEFFGKNDETYDGGAAIRYTRESIGLRRFGPSDTHPNRIGLVAPDPILSDLFINPDGLELWIRNTSNVQISNDIPVNSVHFARQTVTLDGSRLVSFFTDGGTGPDYVNVFGGPDNVETFDYIPTKDRYIQYMSNNLLLNVNAAPIESEEAAPQNRYVGTHSFTVSYSDDKANKFSIKNLHESYKLPTITKTNDASNFAAQQATKYNAINTTGNVPYPVDASMGIMVTNFGYEQVLNTDKYIELKKEYDDNLNTHGKGHRKTLIAEYNLNTTKFVDFFKTPRDAKEAWSNTLWSRLGFTYDQLGDIDKTVETVQTIKPIDNPGINYNMPQERLDKWGLGKQKLKGIITHNDFDFSDIMACANLGGEPIQINGNNVNMFDSVSFANISEPDQFFISSKENGKGDTNLYGIVNKNEFSVMSTSQSIDADVLPDLNAGNSYYLITSDIIKPNGLDANGDPMNLLGIMSKENSSNDTIYSVDGVSNIITEEKLVSELSIEVRNPDNTLVPDTIIGKSSGFILMVEKAINTNTMEVKTI
jgi:hypothetical protein